MKYAAVLVALFLLYPVAPYRVETYAEARPTQGVCHDKNSCTRGGTERACRCDDLCPLYGDCCHDKTWPKSVDSRTTRCTTQGVSAVDICPPNWHSTDESIRKKCNSDVKDWSDPFLMIPLTNNHTGVTYRNYYCALCNNDQDNSAMWNVFLENGDDEVVLARYSNLGNLWEHLVYDRKRRLWGAWLKTELGIAEFCSVNIAVKMPKQLKHRTCDPQLIDACSSNWTEVAVQSMCHRYLCPVHSIQTSFKNLHCAICNHLGGDQSLVSTPPVRIPNNRTVSDRFSILLMDDLTFRSLCPKDSIWDPFFKNCRRFLNAKKEQESFKQRKYAQNVGNNFESKISPNDIQPKQNPVKFFSKATDEYEGIYAQEFLNCLKVPFESDQYEVLPNKSLFLVDANVLFNRHMYLLVDDVAYVCFERLQNQDLGDKPEISKLSKQFRNCKKNYYSSKQYKIVLNTLAYVRKQKLIFSEFLLVNNVLLVCDPDSGSVFEKKKSISEDVSNAPSGRYEYYVTLMSDIAMFISIVCIIIHLIFCCLFEEMRNLPGLNLASLTIALLFAYSFEIWQDNIDNSIFDNKYECIFIGAFSNYFFTAAIFWMNVIAFDICRTLHHATNSLRMVGTQNKWKRFILYSLYAWLTPSVFLVALFVLDLHTDPSHYLRPDFQPPKCVFGNDFAEIYFSDIPGIIIIFLNIVFFGYSTQLVACSPVTTCTADLSNQKNSYKLYLRLALIMGVTWIFVFAAYYTNNRGLENVADLFYMLQGFFIFLLFTNVIKRTKILIERSRKPPPYSAS